LPKGRPISLPTLPDSPLYLVEDLEAATGIPRRTIRFYVSKGILKPARGRGPSATYDKDHLLRLQRLKELKIQHLPLDEIKQELATKSTEDLEAHFAISAGPTEGTWQRIAFGPDYELNVRISPGDLEAKRRFVKQLTQHIWAMIEDHRARND
jgi:DNA-binding transcriptional MerR regulator